MSKKNVSIPGCKGDRPEYFLIFKQNKENNHETTKQAYISSLYISLFYIYDIIYLLYILCK